WNSGAQESGVCGTSAVRIVIDIEGVDSHERGACRQQMLGRLAGEERVARAVPLGPPVGVPPGVYEHRLAPHVSPAKQGGVEPSLGARARADDDSLQIGHSFERIVPDVLPAAEAVERSIDVRPRIPEQLDLPDLEGRARRVACAANCSVRGMNHAAGRAPAPALATAAYCSNGASRKALFEGNWR